MAWYESLIKRFPNLLGNLKELECPSGWETMIEQLCMDIMKHEVFFIENPDYTPVKFVQIKAKFGALRAYYEGGKIKDEYVNMMRIIIDKYEGISAQVCGFCGSTDAKRTSGNFWIQPVCANCIK